MTIQSLKIVLSPECFVAGSTSAGGPATALFNLILVERDKYPVFISEWFKSELKTALIAGGMPVAGAENQVAFISSLCKLVEVSPGGDPLVALAKASEVDVVYCAGRPTGETIEGVRMAPVSELMTKLGLA